MAIGDNFKDLPMAELIGAPLQAVCQSQVQLASASWQFMQTIAFQDDGTPRLLKFDLERPVESEAGIVVNKVSVQAPFIGLVPIPSLLIDNVTIDFQMEVTDVVSSKDTSQSEGSIDASYKSFWGLSVQIHGKVSSSRENTRSTNQTAKYQVHVGASQQPPTEGLSKLMDIMASCTAPLSVTKGS
ncbi:hypothetical protein Cpap_0356 [Ruminiclostridium papyrosolvens DSM 2782]|uniref:DUF2589 domain-containing protein n=1 Tax=Ruminiclostridium papyrosolvens DSM 2782 TaxID=588581 RepID=F1TGT6_9FIRM|nr:DUF2589 domain-containing protein [Ruminiclostridium papyrosolvens]EGD46417.1 hypothetical protein Cpap_0356 [Ruminiclostridium papyrosolvens DSM 2782]WES33970.1 DUF2589 domain-containing protein [Ruminiclostridium papyrosolvens DSM 2782]